MDILQQYSYRLCDSRILKKTYIFLKLGRNSIFKSGLLHRAKAKKVCSFGRLKSAVTTPKASVQV